MVLPKTAYSSNGIVHFTIGAVIKKDNKFLLIDRSNFPEGFACIAGHIEAKETPEQALIREVKEESNLQVVGYKLLYEETLFGNDCCLGVHNHHWFVFECEVIGSERKNEEAKSIGWFSTNEIKSLKLEPSWNHWFKKMKVI